MNLTGVRVFAFIQFLVRTVTKCMFRRLIVGFRIEPKIYIVAIRILYYHTVTRLTWEPHRVVLHGCCESGFVRVRGSQPASNPWASLLCSFAFCSSWFRGFQPANNPWASFTVLFCVCFELVPMVHAFCTVPSVCRVCVLFTSIFSTALKVLK